MAEISRRDFLKGAGIGAATLAAAGAGIYAYSEYQRSKLEPYILSPEETRAACGIAVCNAVPESVDIYLPKNDQSALDHESIFTGTSQDTKDDEAVIAYTSYSLGKIGIWPSDREGRVKLLDQSILFYDIRFHAMYTGGKFLVRVGGLAPPMRGNYPEYDLPPERSVFTIAVGLGELEKFALAPSPLCADQASTHVVNLIRGVAQRTAHESSLASPFVPDDIMTACTVIPQTFFPHADDALRNGSQIDNVAQEVTQLASQLNYPVEQLYVPVRDVNGQIVVGAQLPLGVACDIMAIHQAPSGQMLALVKPRGYSFVSFIDGYASLKDNAEQVISSVPVWIDVSDVHAEYAQDVVAAAQKEQIQVQKTLQEQGVPESFGTPTANILDRAVSGSLPTTTPTIPPTPTEIYVSPTSLPSMTPLPTYTSAPDLSGWNIIEASQTPTPVGGSVPEGNPYFWSDAALSVLCTLYGVIGIGSIWGGIVYINNIRRDQQEKLAEYQRQKALADMARTMPPYSVAPKSSPLPPQELHMDEEPSHTHEFVMKPTYSRVVQVNTADAKEANRIGILDDITRLRTELLQMQRAKVNESSSEFLKVKEEISRLEKIIERM